MKGRMKFKKIVNALIITFFSVIFVWFAGFMVGIFGMPSLLLKYFVDDNIAAMPIDVIHKSYPTDVIIYGKEIEFKEKLKKRNVDELNEKTLLKDKNYDYTAIVINDLDDTVNLDENTIKYIDSLLNTEEYIVLYYGTKYANAWDNYKDNQLELSIKGNLGYRIYNSMGKRQKVIGAWTENDQKILEKYPFLLGDTIIYEIVACLEAMN